MAFFDWNRNGKNDSEDDFIEYNVYMQSMKNENNNCNRKSNMSNFSAGCVTVISIFIAAAILSIFNLDGAALVITFIIVLSVVAAIVSSFFE